MTTSPRLVCIPARDTSFAREVERIAKRIPADLPPEDALSWFEAEVRVVYPTARIREQSDLARSSEEPLWYITRRERFFRIDTAIVVPLAPDAAFEVYVGRVSDWQTAVPLTPRIVTPELIGTEYAGTYEFVGRRFTGTFRIIGADRPHHVTFEANGSGIHVWYTTRFIPEGGGTRVHVVGDYELPGSLLERVADRLGMERAIGRDVERANEAYRLLCDVTAGPPQPDPVA